MHSLPRSSVRNRRPKGPGPRVRWDSNGRFDREEMVLSASVAICRADKQLLDLRLPVTPRLAWVDSRDRSVGLTEIPTCSRYSFTVLFPSASRCCFPRSSSHRWQLIAMSGDLTQNFKPLIDVAGWQNSSSSVP